MKKKITALLISVIMLKPFILPTNAEINGIQPKIKAAFEDNTLVLKIDENANKDEISQAVAWMSMVTELELVSQGENPQQVFSVTTKPEQIEGNIRTLSYNSENHTLTVNPAIFKNVYVENKTYTIIVKAEGYGQDLSLDYTFDFEIPNVSVRYDAENKRVLIESENSDYLNKLNNIQFEGSGGGNIKSEWLNGNCIEVPMDEFNLQRDSEHVRLIADGYGMVRVNVLIPASEDSINELFYQVEVEDNGDLVIKTDENHKDWITGITTAVTGRPIAGLGFGSNAGSATYRYVRRGNGSVNEWFVISQDGTQLRVPSNRLKKEAIPNGEVYLTIQTPKGGNGTNSYAYPHKITLTHDINDIPEDLEVVYNSELKQIEIKTENSYYHNHLERMTIILSSAYGQSTSFDIVKNGNNFVNQNSNLTTVSAESIKEANGGQDLQTGTYDYSIKVGGFLNAESGTGGDSSYRPRLSVLPTIIENDNPVIDNDGCGVHPGNGHSKGIHQHVHTWVKSLYEEDHENNGNCNKKAEDTVRDTTIDENVSAAVIVSATLSDADDRLLANSLSEDKYIVKEFDMSVCIVVDEAVIADANIYELDTAVEYEIELPEELLDDEEQEGRTYYVERVHNGVVETLPATVVGNKLKFSSDKYSAYMVTFTESETNEDGSSSSGKPTVDSSDSSASAIKPVETPLPTPTPVTISTPFQKNDYELEITYLTELNNNEASFEKIDLDTLGKNYDLEGRKIELKLKEATVLQDDLSKMGLSRNDTDEDYQWDFELFELGYKFSKPYKLKETDRVVNIHNIQLELMVDGKNKGNITEGFGTVNLSLNAGEEYSGMSSTVLQVHGEKDVFVHTDLKVDELGMIHLTIDHFSEFIIIVHDLEKEITVTPSSVPSEAATIQQESNGLAVGWTVLGISLIGILIAIFVVKGSTKKQ